MSSWPSADMKARRRHDGGANCGPIRFARPVDAPFESGETVWEGQSSRNVRVASALDTDFKAPLGRSVAWQVPQWCAYLLDRDVPVLPSTRARVHAEASQWDSAPMVTAGILTSDPYLALRALRRAEQRRSRTLGRETSTALACVLQIGMEELVELVDEAPLCRNDLPEINDGVRRGVTASQLAQAWAHCHADVAPGEVAFAALLMDIGQLLLWQFAPHAGNPQGVRQQGNDAGYRENARDGDFGFSVKALTIALGKAWRLPELQALQSRFMDLPRAQIVRTAWKVVRLLEGENLHRELAQEIIGLAAGLNCRPASLVNSLPVCDDVKGLLLETIAGTHQ